MEMSLREIVDACARIDVGGKPLQECMRLGRHGFSAYWLGPLAEKNPLKTPELAGAPLRRRGFTQAALEFTKIACSKSIVYFQNGFIKEQRSRWMERGVFASTIGRCARMFRRK